MTNGSQGNAGYSEVTTGFDIRTGINIGNIEGTQGGKGGDGGSWGQSGGYGFTTAGVASTSLSTGRTYGGPSIKNFSYAKAGSFIGTVNVNYWGEPNNWPG